MTTPILSPTATIADPKDNESILLPKDFGFIPVPRRLRYDPIKPFHFGLLLNIAFGFASTFSESFPLLYAFYCLNLVYSCRESLLLSAITQSALFFYDFIIGSENLLLVQLSIAFSVSFAEVSR